MVIEFDIPHGAERGYFIAFRVAAIYVATWARGEPCVVAASRDLGKSLNVLQRKWPGCEITCAYWVRDRDAAEVIAAEINGVLPHLDLIRLAVRAEIAVRAIEDTAAGWKISLTRHEVAMVRVRTAIDVIEARLKSASDRGELAWFNAAYRQWRRKAKGSGRGMSYRGALARLRNEAIKQLILLGVNELRADLLPRVFPRLPGAAAKIYVDGLEKPVSYSRALKAGRVSARSKSRQELVNRYRSLPDAQRRELTATFKRERARNPKLDWTEFLAARFTLTASKLVPM